MSKNSANRELVSRIQHHVETLCFEVGNRHVGSPGNRAATDYFTDVCQHAGLQAMCSPFECLEWEAGEAALVVGDTGFPLHVGPYSLPCDVRAPFVCASTFDALDAMELSGKIVLLHGDIAAEPIMPKGFVFYNPDHHKRLVALLEERGPAAIIAATGKASGTAGSVYPFPLFEDGDFDIPTAYLKDRDGTRLLDFAGQLVHLQIDSKRIPSTACNPVASLGPSTGSTMLVSAHIDAKKNTPGALDNATGVAVLLALAEMLSGYDGSKRIELVAFNGEDYYAVPGQMLYLSQVGARMQDIDLVINLDGAGHNEADIAYSFYNCDPSLESLANQTFSAAPGLVPGAPWAQGDHSMFTMAGRPAIALTSTNFDWLCQEITHTPKDHPNLVDCAKLAEAAHALHRLLSALS